jgi:serine/threonine protein kinase
VPFDKDFKELFTQMMALNPKHRLSIEQVLKHPWMMKEKANPAELLSEFTSRKQLVD